MDNDELQKKLILIVNDDYHILRSLEIYLTMEEFQVIMAINGRDALEVLEEILPDLIFLNKQMPVMDGYEALDHIRADTRTSDIPVIMHSADSPDFSDYRRNRFDDYFTCPFNLSEVVDAIRSLLQEREKKGRMSRKELHSRAEKLKTLQEKFMRRLRDTIEEESTRYKWRAFAQQGEEKASVPVHTQTRINPKTCMNELVIMLLLKEGKEVIQKLEDRAVSEQGSFMQQFPPLFTVNPLLFRNVSQSFMSGGTDSPIYPVLTHIDIEFQGIPSIENLPMDPGCFHRMSLFSLNFLLLSQKCCFRSFIR
ncbi:MAG: PleD family two-component system response regulator [Candidatus Xenobiia bacterium LiM19]